MVLCECEAYYCSVQCLVASDIEMVLDEQISNDDDYKYNSCCRCRYEVFDQDELYQFALQILNTSNKELSIKYRATKINVTTENKYV